MSNPTDELLRKLKERAQEPEYLNAATEADTLLVELTGEAAASRRHDRNGDGAGVLFHGIKASAAIEALDHDQLVALAIRAVFALADVLEPEAAL